MNACAGFSADKLTMFAFGEETSPADAFHLALCPACRGQLARLRRVRAAASELRLTAELPRDQREVFLLREQGGLSFPEIAAATGDTLSAVLGRMNQAVSSLQAVLAAMEMDQ